ncbi:mannitol dehydrogenase family protein [Acutalibacter caecimuris]|uniref:mannitol dehydrogenase family protein n=1 Tax=Acutalibacter caecimuris TaxID=3093657 RepID=UPI002AC9CCDF|nr:mannitol dehydrogenase family protein [Acutalibacter sp. M00118]
MKLTLNGIQNPAPWQAAGITLPGFDIGKMRAATAASPRWVHFGAGNIFRGFIARLQQNLLEQGLAETGIIAAEAFDFDIITQIYAPHDNLALLATLLADGGIDKTVVASLAEGLRAGEAYPQDMARLVEVFQSPSLQMVSFTITEKGYALRDLQGEFLPAVQASLAAGPGPCPHMMGLTAALLFARWQAGATPVALVSMDNCSHNGEKLRESVLALAEGWLAGGLVPQGFVDWLKDEGQVSFPWTMIDKITPRPAPAVEAALSALGVEDMAPAVTGRGTYIAPFVNAERPQYLVIEDRFPHGRPPLEQAGAYLASRETVDLAERMKVTTCLNPLHTALAVFGCLLGYPTIAAEMGDPDLRALVERIGYSEGLPVVENPGILRPETFLREVLQERLPNPFLPDTPQRIATDTSQKVAVRFGETVKRYAAKGQAGELVGIPLAIAGWLRYLLGVDDTGAPLSCSADPMLETLQSQLQGVRFGQPDSAPDGALAPVLSNTALFGIDLCAAGLAPKTGQMLRQMLAGPGAVRATLKSWLG